MIRALPFRLFSNQKEARPFLPERLSEEPTQATASPKVRFLPYQLILPTDIAYKIHILQIYIAGKPQFLDSFDVQFGLCGEFFSPSSRIRLDYDPCPANAEILIALANVSGARLPFAMHMVGDTDDGMGQVVEGMNAMRDEDRFR